jgi:putative ABC transport system substrate-binding protein
MGVAGRRNFLAAAGALLATPPAALAQEPGRSYWVGLLLGGPDPMMQSIMRVIRERLAEHGFAEGRNLSLVPRRGVFGSAELNREEARRLLESKLDALFTYTSFNTLTAQELAGSVPIVFAVVGDAVVFGIVKDYRRPGGNTTGVSWRQHEVTLKRLELLREILPSAKRIVLVAARKDVSFAASEKAFRGAAAGLGLELIDVEYAGSKDLAADTIRAARTGADAIFVYQPFTRVIMATPLIEIIRQALELRIPVSYTESEMAEQGGLFSYGPDFNDDLRRAADQLARVLKGARAGELAVDLSARFDLVVNLRTARALGIVIPPALLLRANRVIE